MKIAILDDYQDAVRKLTCFNLLDGHEVKVFHHSASGVGQLAVRLAPFEALVLIRERTRISRALLQKLPNLKLISQTGRLANHIDLEAAKELGICVTEGGGDPRAPAELAFALILAARRKLLPYASLLRQGAWQTSSLQAQHNTLGRVLYGQTLGIWGFGKIGRLLAGYGAAFGMRILVWGSEASRAAAQQAGWEAAASRQQFFAESDVLSLHLRLLDATRGIVQAEDLALMKSDALLVNTSRAELIAPGALLAALRAGRPGYAALDVFEREPPAADEPLLQLENVLATPHLGYVERESYERYFSAAFQNVLDFIAGKARNCA
ncbi:D-2-hydroxyacid dehydrogenase family protein [Massilia sp. W12]|uniref:D-2-hydroxyacid dehydrogenase family protein n=1 Tax=Massilia sp. W12 TaxID=3126507 RepID=UPI0030D0BFC2